MSSDRLLSRALGVLAKADSTSFDAERSALVYGGYVLLARYLAAHPGPVGPDGRRRERRLVADRRQPGGAAPDRRPHLPAAYRAGVPGDDRGRVLDARI